MYVDVLNVFCQDTIIDVQDTMFYNMAIRSLFCGII